MKDLILKETALEQVQEEQTIAVLSKREIDDLYGLEDDNHPSVYCGTYGKYNNGSLFGLWLDLTKFDDYDEFVDVCRQLHADEEDPELMFQDFMSFPESLYCESLMDEETFDKIIEFAEMGDNREAFEDYMELGHNFDVDRFNEAFCGYWDSEEDFARMVVEECYDLDSMGILSSYFDYKSYARDLFMDDYQMSENNYVFRRL